MYNLFKKYINRRNSILGKEKKANLNSLEKNYGKYFFGKYQLILNVYLIYE